MLQRRPDAALEALHERFTGLSRADRERGDMAAAEAFVSMLFGDEVLRGHQATSADELFEYASSKVDEQERLEQVARAEKAARRRARGNDADKRAKVASDKAEAERAATQSVREIFRKLASALHPDRERDAAERERKTLLMQRVNEAYERRDLLGLLTLQIEIEQIDADHLSNVPAARLAHYNQLLREQLDTLELQGQELSQHLRLELDIPEFGAKLTQPVIDHAMNARIAELRSLLRNIERDLDLLADRQSRRQVLDALPNLEDGDPDLAFDLDAFGEHPEPPPQRHRSGGRRKRRKGKR